MGKKVAVSAEEKKLSYYKYFERDLAPIPEEKLAILAQGPAPAEKLIPFEEKDLFLKGEDEDYLQIGYGIAANGTGLVCNATYMPGVTGEMLDWWFPWHSVGSDLRYKIWDPEDHYFAKAHKASYVLDPNVPNNQKTWGVMHHIMEDVGPGPEFLLLQFLNPQVFGYDTSIIGTEKCESLVCASGVSSLSAAMTHKWYPYKDGVMFCSRFWMGYGFVEEGKLGKIVPEGISVPDFVAKGLFAHNIKEFSNLAAILPEVYAEEKDNW